MQNLLSDSFLCNFTVLVYSLAEHQNHLGPQTCQGIIYNLNSYSNYHLKSNKSKRFTIGSKIWIQQKAEEGNKFVHGLAKVHDYIYRQIFDNMIQHCCCISHSARPSHHSWCLRIYAFGGNFAFAIVENSLSMLYLWVF